MSILTTDINAADVKIGADLYERDTLWMRKHLHASHFKDYTIGATVDPSGEGETYCGFTIKYKEDPRENLRGIQLYEVPGEVRHGKLKLSDSPFIEFVRENLDVVVMHCVYNNQPYFHIFPVPFWRRDHLSLRWMEYSSMRSIIVIPKELWNCEDLKKLDFRSAEGPRQHLVRLQEYNEIGNSLNAHKKKAMNLDLLDRYGIVIDSRSYLRSL